MLFHHIKKGVEILKKEGIIVFFINTASFIYRLIEKHIWKFIPTYYRIKIFKTRTYKNRIINDIKYAAVADPGNKIKLDPKWIKYKNKRSTKPRYGLGQIVNGDWDLPENRKPIEDYFKYKGLQQRFIKGMDWEETVYYQYYDGKLENNDKLIRRCKSNDYLFKDMKKYGYATNANSKTEIKRPFHNDSYRDKLNLEILVTIGRNGEFNLYDGWHRFTMARILNIDASVQVLARHKEWQKTRDEIYRNGFSEQHTEELRYHPDLQDVINN